MLSERFWQALRLDPAEVEQRARFFEAFAKLMADPASPQPSQLAELSRFADPKPGLESFGDPPGSGDEPRFEEAERELPAAGRPAWERTGFVADSLRQAAISMLLVDTRRGLDLLAAAGEQYMGANRAFGTLLQAVTAPSPISAEMAVDTLRAQYYRPRARRRDRPEPIDQAEEIHLALAASSIPGMVEDELLGGFRRRPGARSPTPFGTGAAAVFEWWEFSSNLLAGALRVPRRTGQRWLGAELVRLARGNGRQLAAAQLDAHHWRKFAGIPELVDIDLACAVCLANRQLAALDEEPLSGEEFHNLMKPPLDSPINEPELSLAQVSLHVGIEMARPDEEPPPAAAAGPLAEV